MGLLASHFIGEEAGWKRLRDFLPCHARNKGKSWTEHSGGPEPETEPLPTAKLIGSRLPK